MNTRYQKQALFLGNKGQAQLQNAQALIIGAGALGSASAEMLARAGVGTLTIVDRDYVEYSNLQRQQLYTEADARGKLPKAVAAKTRLQHINSEITINSHIVDINASNIEALVKNQSIIIDATDNFETRMVINDAAVKHSVPFIFGACVGSYGLTFPILPGQTPCLHCLMNHLPLDGMTCDTVGVISPIVQIIASFQVTQALKLLTDHKLDPTLQSLEIWKNEKAEINIANMKNKNCPTCSEHATFPYLSFENQTKTDVLCGRDAVQIRPGSPLPLSINYLSERIRPLVTQVIVNPYLLSCSFEDYRVVIFKDGRAIIHGTNDASKARTVYNRIIQL
ncbi:ThiF family adenylyltransferase [Lysinibacillus sp. NPDC097287]|uniref:ThiF family adenylyltransferase n=1 Tax=Lysinibacillus sp. NPDC097287 TaxID=3364144 RepID=UPI00381A77AB